MLSLAHGDARIENFLWPKNAAGELEPVSVLDWQILHVENPDLYKYLTLQLPSPSGLGENPVYVELLAWVEEKNLLTKR